MCVWVVNEPDLSVRFIGQPCKLPASSTLSELQEAILTARWFQLCWKHYALSQLCHLELVSTILTLGMSFKCCYHMITWPCSAYTHTHTHTNSTTLNHLILALTTSPWKQGSQKLRENWAQQVLQTRSEVSTRELSNVAPSFSNTWSPFILRNN